MTHISRRAFTVGTLAIGLGRPAWGQEPRRGGTLVATLGADEPRAPYVPSGGGPSALFASSKVLERLGRRKMTGEFTGELAEGWTTAADFKSYTVKLAKGVKFHDGQELSVDDVIYSIDQIWKKHAATRQLADYAGSEAAAGDTVVMKFTRPTPEYFFGALMCGDANYIVSRNIYGGSDPTIHPANTAPTGTGPWKFKEWVRGSHIEYVRNEAYRRPEFPYMDRLILRFVRDPAGRAAALEAGEIQLGVFNPVPPADLKRLAATAKFVATSKGYEEAQWATTMECNLRRPLFEKPEVRQAMFYAVDRGLIARSVYYGYARPGTGPIFSSNREFFTPDTFGTPYDPKKAASLLDAAGYPKKGWGKRFSVELVAGGWFADNGKVGTIVKQGLEEVGIEVNLTVPDRAASIKRLYTDYDFDLAISNQENPSEPVPLTTQYYTSDGIRKGVPFCNASGFHSDEVDQLVDKIKTETDPAKRKALVADFQRIITREAPCLPLVELETNTLASTRVQNHSNDPNFLAASWHDLWLAE